MLFTCIACSKEHKNKDSQKNTEKIQSQIVSASKHLSDGNPGKAIDILEAVFDKNQDSADVLELLGFAYLQDHDNGLAAFHFEKAAEMDASKSMCFLHAARANLADGETSKAICDYEQYLDAFDDDYAVFNELAEVFLQINKVDEAFKIYCVIANNITNNSSFRDENLVKMANIFWQFHSNIVPDR